MRNDYGKRGGTSANAGLKATCYKVALPDGTVARKRSYAVDADEAEALAYMADGKWHVSGVYLRAPTWGRVTVCKAVREA